MLPQADRHCTCASIPCIQCYDNQLLLVPAVTVSQGLLNRLQGSAGARARHSEPVPQRYRQCQGACIWLFHLLSGDAGSVCQRTMRHAWHDDHPCLCNHTCSVPGRLHPGCRVCCCVYDWGFNTGRWHHLLRPDPRRQQPGHLQARPDQDCRITIEHR